MADELNPERRDEPRVEGKFKEAVDAAYETERSEAISQPTKVPFKSLPRDQQIALRKQWLAVARDKKAAMLKEGTLVLKGRGHHNTKQSITASVGSTLSSIRQTASEDFTSWTDEEWTTSSLNVCKARLSLLKKEWERGSTIVGKRSDQNDPATYRCFVCGEPISERSPSGKGPGWVWKNDYMNKATGLYESVVIDKQSCHTIFINDQRMQNRLKDLLNGTAADKQPQTT